MDPDTNADRIEKATSELIERAAKAGRWEAPIGWWGIARGSLDGMVSQDLGYLVNGYSAEELYQRCIRGADESDHPSWREYIDDLAAAAEEFKAE